MDLQLNVSVLKDIMAYKGFYALCMIKSNKELKATHIACCMSGGPNPIWAVWTIHGTLQRLLGSKEQIAKAYPDRVFRRVMATWKLSDGRNKSLTERRTEIEKRYHKRLPKTAAVTQPPEQPENAVPATPAHLRLAVSN